MGEMRAAPQVADDATRSSNRSAWTRKPGPQQEVGSRKFARVASGSSASPLAGCPSRTRRQVEELTGSSSRVDERMKRCTVLVTGDGGRGRRESFRSAGNASPSRRTSQKLHSPSWARQRMMCHCLLALLGMQLAAPVSQNATCAPIFVSSIGALGPDSRTEVSCFSLSACQFPVFARQSGVVSFSSQNVAIVAAPNASGPFSPQHILRYDGRPCATENDAIACIFRIPQDEAGTTAGRLGNICFVAQTRGDNGTCSSDPKCFKIAFTHETQQPDQQLVDLNVYAGMSPYSTPGAEIIRLSWQWSSEPPAAFLLSEHLKFQYTRDGQPFSDLPADRSADTTHSFLEFPLRLVVGPEGQIHEDSRTVLQFRVIAVVGGQRYVSLPCNELRIFHGEELPGRLHLVTWQSQMMRAYRATPAGSQVEALGEYPSHPIVSGASAIDNVRSRLVLVTAQPGDAADPTPMLLVIDLHEAASVMPFPFQGDARLFCNTSFWNLQVDPEDGHLLVTTVNASGFAILTLALVDNTTIIAESDYFPCHVRQAVSAFDSNASLYWFIDSADNAVRFYNRSQRSFSSGIGLCDMAPTSCAAEVPVILHMAFDSIRRRLHLVAGPWRSGGDSPLTLIVFDPLSENDPSSPSTVIRTAVRVSGSDFFSFAFDFARRLLFASRASNSLTHRDALMITWDMRSNTSSKSVLSHVGQVVGLQVQTDLSPVIQSLSPAVMQPIGLEKVTITGLNFGLMDKRPVVKIDGIPCNTSTWVSSNTLYCITPPLIQLNAGHVFSVTVGLGRFVSPRIDGAGHFEKDEWRTASPTVYQTLLPGNPITVSGLGFFAPFSHYRCAFSSGHQLLLSGPPISASAANLTFNTPVFLQRTTSMSIYLLHASQELGEKTILDRAVYRQQSLPPIVVSFEEMFGTYAPKSAHCDGSSADLRILGLGFDHTQRAAYQCLFSADDHASQGAYVSVRVLAFVKSSHEITCSIPVWPYHHGVARLQLLFRGNPILHMEEEQTAPSEYVDFTFQELWLSVQPSTGLMTGGTQITVAGLGFSQGKTYFCRLQSQSAPYRKIDLPGQVVSPRFISCLTSGGAGVSAGPSSTISLFDDNNRTVLFKGTFPVVFHFEPEWQSISVTQGTTSGGAHVLVNGAGLSNLTHYRCVFSDGSVQNATAAVFLSSSQIACTSPAWPGRAGSVEVRIFMSDAQGAPIDEFKLTGTNSPATFSFTFMIEVDSIAPTEAFAPGMTVFTIHGKGFDVSSADYQCVLRLSDGSNAYVAAHASNEQELVCGGLKWNASASSTWISVVQYNQLISVQFHITFKQEVTMITASDSVFASGGGVVSVYGAGFTVSGNYLCDVRQEGTTVLEVTASPVAHDEFQCVLGPINAPAGEVQVLVTQSGSGQTLGSHTFSIFSTVEDISMTSGTAAGGDSVNVSGYGFIPGEQYVLSFHRSAWESQSVTCEFRSHALLVCTTSVWNYVGGIAEVSVADTLGYLAHVSKNLTFDFTPEVIRMLGPSQSSAGARSVVLVAGHGFDESESAVVLYTCSFGSTSNVVNSTGRAINSSLIECVVPLWQFAATDVELVIVGGRLPATALQYRFLSETFSMTPNHGILQGTIITIRATGLNAGGTYSCLISSHASVQNVSAQLLVSDFQTHPERPGKWFNFELTCQLPQLANCDEFLVSIIVLETETDKRIKGLYDFEYTEGLLAIVPRAGAATGGFPLTLVGCGFHGSRTYRAAFRDPAVPSRFEISDVARFVNASAIVVEMPYWGFGAALAGVGLQFDDFEDSSANISFDIHPVATSALPTSGYVFGSYLLVKGHGFGNSPGFHACVLQSQTNNSERFEVEAFARGGSKELECEIVRWPYATSVLNVNLLYGTAPNRRVVPQIEGPITFELLSAWLYADLGPSVPFSGGTAITIRGGGFNPDGGPIYTCLFTDVNQGSCPVHEVSRDQGFHDLLSDCTQAHSSDLTLPLPSASGSGPHRGPYIAKSRELVVCYTPAWIRSSESKVALRLYEGQRLVEKLYVPSLVTTNFTGGPVVGSDSTTNAHAEGDVLITILGANFAYADVSPGARMGPTACTYTEWVSNSHISCRTPQAQKSTVDLALTVSPYRLGKLRNFFTYDGPSVDGVDNAQGNYEGPRASIILGAVLPLTKQEFDPVRQFAYRQVIAETAYVNVTDVIILNITEANVTVSNTTNGTADAISRRLLAASYAVVIEVDTEIRLADEKAAQEAIKDLTIAALTSQLQNASVLTMSQTLTLPLQPVVIQHGPASRPVGNAASRAVQMVLVMGRYFNPSAGARVGGSACMASIWQSDSKILCKTADAVGYFEHLSVTIERVVGTRRGMITYDSPVVAWNHSVHIATNMHTLVGAPLTTTGVNFGASADYTLRAVIGATGAMSSEWLSDTTIYCRTSPGVAASKRVTLTVESILRGSISEAVSYDVGAVRLTGNTARYPPTPLGIIALHLGIADTSLQARFGGSAQENTLWASATSIKAMVGYGSGRSRRVVVTVGSSAGSGTVVLSYDGPSVLYAHDEIDEGIRVAGVPFSESGVGSNITMACETRRATGSHLRMQTCRCENDCSLVQTDFLKHHHRASVRRF